MQNNKDYIFEHIKIGKIYKYNNNLQIQNYNIKTLQSFKLFNDIFPFF